MRFFVSPQQEHYSSLSIIYHLPTSGNVTRFPPHIELTHLLAPSSVESRREGTRGFVSSSGGNLNRKSQGVDVSLRERWLIKWWGSETHISRIELKWKELLFFTQRSSHFICSDKLFCLWSFFRSRSSSYVCMVLLTRIWLNQKVTPVSRFNTHHEFDHKLDENKGLRSTIQFFWGTGRFHPPWSRRFL